VERVEQLRAEVASLAFRDAGEFDDEEENDAGFEARFQREDEECRRAGRPIAGECSPGHTWSQMGTYSS